MRKLITKQVKRLKNPLFLLLLVVAIGLGAYFLSGTQFFKGMFVGITDDEIATQNAEMDKVKRYVSAITGTKGAIWPIQAAKETVFEVTDKGPVTFTSERGYGEWRVLHSDFIIEEVPNGDGLMYQLTDTSTALGTEITKICINYGVGASPECQSYGEINSFTYTYENAGTYTVEVRVEDARGRSDSSSQTIEVEQKTPTAEPGPEEPEEPVGSGESQPVVAAEITAACKVRAAGLTVTFTDESVSTNPDAVPVNQWNWNFIDGQTSAEQNPVHTYTAGTYKVTLEAGNQETGIKDSVDCTVTVAAPAPALIADFEIAPATYDYNGVSHSFYNKSNANPLQKATWDFGEGPPMTLEGSTLVDTNLDGTNGDTSHVYKYPVGNGGLYETIYPVSLEVFDGTNSATANKDLIVKKPVRADFTCEWNSIATSYATRSAAANNIIIKVNDVSEKEEGIEIATKQVSLAGDETTIITPSTKNNVYALGQNKSIKYTVNTSITSLYDTKTVEDVTIYCAKNDELVAYNPSWPDLIKADSFAIKAISKTTPSVPKGLKLPKDVKLPEGSATDEKGEAAAAVRVNPDSVTAEAGSTVYFKANCLSGEMKVRIVPGNRPLEAEGLILDLNGSDLSKLKSATDSKSAVLDIFKNQADCPVEEEEEAEDVVVEEEEEEEDVKEDDVKEEDVKEEDVKEEDVKEEDVKEEDVKEEDVKEEDVKEDDVKEDDVKEEDVKEEDVKEEDVKEDDKKDTKREVPKEEKTLGIPEITKPEKNQIFTHTPRTINIAWTLIPNAAAYDLELGCDWCESNTDKWANPGKFESSETAYTPTAPLPNDGEYRIRVRAKNTDLTGEWSNYTYFSFDTAPKYECNDGKDNDGDGYIDFGADAGCKTPEDPDEENPPARIETECSDGKDNDADGYIDLVDIGCEDSNDVNEKNKTEPVELGATFKQFCHDSVDPKDFTDITEDDYEEIIRDIIKEEASTAYNAEPFEGEPIFIGYPKSGDTVFKPDQAIRRDEVMKILELATCLPEHLKALDEYSLEESDFDDPEFDNPNYWASDYMYLAKNADIIDKGNVAAKVSRSEFLKILLNIHAKVTGEDIESCQDKEIPFVDVTSSSWYCPYAVKAYEIGIAEGLEDKYGNLRLSPNSILTRIDAAIWLRNYYVAITGSSFADTVGGASTIKPIEKISR